MLIRNCFTPDEIKDYKFVEFPKTIQNYDFVYEGRELKIVPTDVVDFHAEIQSYKDETGLSNILKMIAKTGDVSLLNQRSPSYGVEMDIGDELDIHKVEAAAKASEKSIKEVLGDDVLTMKKADLDKLISDKVNQLIAAQKDVEKEVKDE